MFILIVLLCFPFSLLTGVMTAMLFLSPMFQVPGLLHTKRRRYYSPTFGKQLFTAKNYILCSLASVIHVIIIAFHKHFPHGY